MTRFTATCLQAGALGTDRVSRVADVVGRIESAGADLIVLPELWPVGYFAFDDYAAAAEPLDGPTVTALRHAAKAARAHVVIGSFVERSKEGLHNTTAVIDSDGRLLASYRKIHVFGYGSRETELITPGRRTIVVDTELGRLGLAICYDLRFPELFRALVDEGAEVFVIPAAWPQARTEHWRLLTRARAIENQAYVIACNGAGAQDGTTLAGYSAVIDPWGATVQEATYAPGCVNAYVDLEQVEACRRDFPALSDRRLGRDEVAA